MRARIAFLLTLAFACSSPTAPSAVGRWGGTEASLILTRSGGTVSYPCGAGTIDSTWTLSPDGKFTASGQHYFEAGARQTHPARYSGLVEGAYFTLTVTLTDLNQSFGPYRLTRGGPVVAVQCQ